MGRDGGRYRRSDTGGGDGWVAQKRRDGGNSGRKRRVDMKKAPCND